MNRNETRRCRSALSLAVVIGCCTFLNVHRVESQPRPAIDIDIAVVDGRPIAALILQLETRYGWVITYEDPPYESAIDVEDVTLGVSTKNPTSKNRVLVPRLRSFAFQYHDSDQTHPRDVLPAVLRDYHLTNNSEEFRLIQTGSVFHVVPRMSVNAQGIPTNRQSRLDVPVTVEYGERSVLEMLELVVGQVRLATGIRVSMGTVPMNFLAQKRIRAGATDEAARDVLVRALAAAGSNLSWRLLCDPGATKMCAFNVHFIPAPK